MNIVMTFSDLIACIVVGLGLLAIGIIYITYKIASWFEKKWSK